MRRTFACLGLICFVSHSLMAQRKHLGFESAWSILQCTGQKQMAVGLGVDEPTLSTSKDQMKVERKADILIVTVNGQEFIKRFGTDSSVRDTYIVANETEHGLGAYKAELNDAVVHTLVINDAGKNAIWTESGVSWIAPFALFNSTVTFTCSPMKRAK